MEPLGLSQAMLPLMPHSTDSQDFDYRLFLPEPGDYHGAEGSSSNSEFALAKVSSASPPSRPPGKGKSVSATRLGRKGHTKSRRGCYNCKRRRIKCQETPSACAHCIKAGLQCEYPAGPQIVHQPQHQVPLFSLQDMRFFQHFLFKVIPHHPLGNEDVWQHEVPCLSHTHDYLMHAILGLAASDLTSSEEDRSLVASAMTHRLAAIRAIKRALAQPLPGSASGNNEGDAGVSAVDQGNALLATCFTLVFQSVSLDDGMAEFMTFVRGVLIVATQMYYRGATRFIFRNWLGEEPNELLRPHMEKLPPIDRQWTDMAVEGIRGLRPLCALEVEIEYQRLLLDIAEALYTSPFTAYKLLSKHYGWWMQIKHEEFAHLVDPASVVCTLLASHWIALKQIMATITEQQWEAGAKVPEREDRGMDVGMGRWLKYLNRQVGADYRLYNLWPVWVEEHLDRDPKFFGRRPH